MNLFAATGLSVGLSCIFLAGFTAIFGKTRLHRLLSCFNLVVAIWGIGLFLVGIATDQQAARAAWKIAHLGGFLVGPVFFHFISIFCEKGHRRILFLAYGQGILFLIISLTSDVLFSEFNELHGIVFFKVNALYTVSVLFYVFFILFAYYELIGYLKIARGNKRSQALYNIFCFSFGFLGGSATFLPIYQTGYFFPASNLGITFYVFVLSYAIMRHKLMDIQLVFKRTLIYSVSACLVTGLFVTLVLLLTKLFLYFYGHESFFSIVISALVISMVFSPVKKKVSFYVDSLFFKNKIVYSQVLK